MSRVFRVYLEGLQPGVDPHRVVEGLAAGFRVTAGRIEAFLREAPVVVKSEADYPTALRYQRLIENAGAQFRMEEVARAVASAGAEGSLPIPMDILAAALGDGDSAEHEQHVEGSRSDLAAEPIPEVDLPPPRPRAPPPGEASVAERTAPLAVAASAGQLPGEPSAAAATAVAPADGPGRICPKCQYGRTEADDLVPVYECPRCGIVYEKFERAQARKAAAEAAVDLPLSPGLIEDFAPADGADPHGVASEDDELETVTEERFDALQEAIPTVQSAYRSSGKTTPKAVALISAGIVPAGVLSALSGAAIGLLSKLFASVVIWFLALISEIPGYFLARIVLLLLAYVVLVVGPAGGAGAAAGWAVHFLGKHLKNRNRVFVVTASVSGGYLGLSLLIAVAAQSGLLLWYSPELAEPGVIRIVAMVGAAVSVPVGYAGIYATYSEDKFCERCAEWMEPVRYRRDQLDATLPIEEGMEAHKALAQGDVVATAAILSRSRGGFGPVRCAPALFQCPSCGSGYFEMTTHCTVSAQGTEGQERAWLVVSVPMEAEKARKIRGSMGG